MEVAVVQLDVASLFQAVVGLLRPSGENADGVEGSFAGTLLKGMD